MKVCTENIAQNNNIIFVKTVNRVLVWKKRIKVRDS